MSDLEKPALADLTTHDRLFLEQVRQLMESYFATDVRRIAHAHDVTEHAVSLLSYVDADPVVTLCAAYLHDIGIPEAERKYDRCDAKLQEQEGPPIARVLLADIGADDDLINQVCGLVGNHHTPQGVDSPEFRVLWDADALVNLAEVVDGKNSHAIESILLKALVTEAGYRAAKALYLPDHSGPAY